MTSQGKCYELAAIRRLTSIALHSTRGGCLPCTLTAISSSSLSVSCLPLAADCSNVLLTTSEALSDPSIRKEIRFGVRSCGGHEKSLVTEPMSAGAGKGGGTVLRGIWRGIDGGSHGRGGSGRLRSISTDRMAGDAIARRAETLRKFAT